MRIIGFALVISSVLIGVKKLATEQHMLPSTGEARFSDFASAGLLLPVILLKLQNASLESQWSSELARVIHGQPEVTVANGRVDVLSDFYAIKGQTGKVA